MKKFKKMGNNDAVSEIIAVMILLVIAISVVAYVYLTVFSSLTVEDEINVDIHGKIENGDVVFTHFGGEPLHLDSVVSLSIAGQTEELIVRDHLNQVYQDDGVWNIGENLVFINYTDLEDEEVDLPKVSSIITDIISNSPVFYGVLQDGEIIPNRGGLWHFDEGSGNWAYDALGYNPPGLVFGANWTSGVMNTCLDFNGVIDKVTVRDSNALDISDNITIEGWLKPSSDALLSEIELDANFGYNPRVIHIRGDLYAVVYQGFDSGAGDGILKTFEIGINGDINDTTVDELIFGDSSPQSLEPMIILINDDVYGILFRNLDDEANLKTVKIFPNGTIDDSIIDSFILDTNTPDVEPDIIHVIGDIYAIAYGDKNNAKLQTIQISPDGVINGSIDKITFDSAKCEDPELIHVSGNIFAITYIKNPTQTTIRTVEILSNGTITISPDTFIDELIIENEGTDDPNIIHVNGSLYAVTYSRKNENYGEIASFTIDNTGQISDTIVDVFRYDNDKCEDPNIIHHGGEVYLIAYASTTPHTGFVVSIYIQPNGDIRETTSPYYTYAEDQGYEPHLLRVNENVYAIVYRGWSPHTGHLATINPYENSDPTNSGIVKRGAYGIHANITKAYGTINDQTISGNISGGWQHIALTYDGNFMTLFANGSEIASQPYTGQINRNSNDLVFGSIFIGKIDEVAIHDRVLLKDEILNHYNTQKP